MADFRSRTLLGDSRAFRDPQGESSEPPPADSTRTEPLPTPPDPSMHAGSAFAAALLARQLPPSPAASREILLRLGGADLPAQGSLALHDRLV